MEKSLLAKLKNKQWYNQRFDGSPLFLYFMGSADVLKDKRKPKNTNGVLDACFFQHGKADWYFNMEEIVKGSDSMIKAAKKDYGISAKLLKKWKKDEKAFNDFFWKKFPKIKLQKLSENELAKLMHLVFKLFTKATSSTSIIDRFALGTDEMIGNMLREEIFSGKASFKESEFTGVFAALTAPIHQSFINRAEIDLLKIILGKSKQSLENYQKKYFWTKNNYVTAQILDTGHFEEEIKAWKDSGKNLRLELERIEQTPKLNRQKKQDLLKKVKISPLLKSLLRISEDFTWWQDERKKYTYYNIHMGYQVLLEISKRTGYSAEELKYALLPDISSILNYGKPSRSDLQKRMDNSVFVLTQPKSYIFSGKDADLIKKAMLGGKAKHKTDDFRGLSASTGRVMGPVKVVKSATEIGKVQNGDILVAVMTRPDYVPAMKKAAAIVTNEGGITSHAAIVSRELGIPCIIGTKIATEVLKDGDMVEVNANHGWVRKVK